MRIFDFNGSTKTIAATTAQTLIWTGSDLPGSGVVGYMLSLQAAGNTLADVDRIRVKARGQTIYDLTTAQLRGLLEATNLPRAVYATTLQSIWIPFFDLSEPREEEQDLQQFPVGEVPTVEVTLSAAATAAGSAIMGWCLTDQPAEYFPRLLSNAHAIGASTTNGRCNFSEPEDFRGIAVPSTGLIRARLVHNGRSIFNLPGTSYATGIGDMVQESTRLRSNYATNAVTDPLWLLPRTNQPAIPGQSFLEADTAAGWSATGEVCIYGRSRQVR